MSNQEKINAIDQELQSILNSYYGKNLSTRNAFELKDKLSAYFIGLAKEGILSIYSAQATIDSLRFFVNLKTNEIRILNDDEEVDNYRKKASIWKEF